MEILLAHKNRQSIREPHKYVSHTLRVEARSTLMFGDAIFLLHFVPPFLAKKRPFLLHNDKRLMVVLKVECGEARFFEKRQMLDSIMKYYNLIWT